LAKEKAGIGGAQIVQVIACQHSSESSKEQDEGQAPERQHDFPPKMEKHGKDTNIFTQSFRCVGYGTKGRTLKAYLAKDKPLDHSFEL
jgi:hypothetical protein